MGNKLPYVSMECPRIREGYFMLPAILRLPVAVAIAQSATPATWLLFREDNNDADMIRLYSLFDALLAIGWVSDFHWYGTTCVTVVPECGHAVSVLDGLRGTLSGWYLYKIASSHHIDGVCLPN